MSRSFVVGEKSRIKVRQVIFFLRNSISSYDQRDFAEVSTRVLLGNTLTFGETEDIRQEAYS